MEKVVFVGRGKIIKTQGTNWHKASVLVNANFIRLDNKDYKVECNKVDLDTKTLELHLKDISIRKE